MRPGTWEERLILFVGYLIDKQLKSTTIRCYISAIKSVLHDNGQVLDEDLYLLKSLTQACRLQNDKVTVCLPIRKPLLFLLLEACEQIYSQNPQPFLMVLYQAMLSTMYFGLFHIGEVTSSDHILKAKDVKMGTNKKKMAFILRTSKTHGLGNEPQKIKITSVNYGPLGHTCIYINRDNNRWCPFTLLQAYLDIRKKRASDTEQFFVFRDRTPIIPACFRNSLKQLLSFVGLDCSLYGTHSLRAGRSVDLFDLGVDLGTICKIGRWRSSAIYAYLKP